MNKEELLKRILQGDDGRLQRVREALAKSPTYSLSLIDIPGNEACRIYTVRRTDRR
jgi:hypothetical protein